MKDLYVYLGRNANDTERGSIGILEPRKPGWQTRTFRSGCLGIQVLDEDVRPLNPTYDRIANP